MARIALLYQILFLGCSTASPSSSSSAWFAESWRQIGGVPPVVTEDVAWKEVMATGEEKYVLKCPIEGSGPITYRWFKNNEEIDDIKWTWFSLRGDNNRKLKVKKMTVDTIGRYKCKATNGFGTAQFTFQLSIKGSNARIPPQLAEGQEQLLIEGVLTNITVAEGNLFKLEVRTKRQMDLKWLKKVDKNYRDEQASFLHLQTGRYMVLSPSSSSRHAITDGYRIEGGSYLHTLIVLSADPEDSGEYMCVIFLPDQDLQTNHQQLHETILANQSATVTVIPKGMSGGGGKVEKEREVVAMSQWGILEWVILGIVATILTLGVIACIVCRNARQRTSDRVESEPTVEKLLTEDKTTNINQSLALRKWSRASVRLSDVPTIPPKNNQKLAPSSQTGPNYQPGQLEPGKDEPVVHPSDIESLGQLAGYNNIGVLRHDQNNVGLSWVYTPQGLYSCNQIMTQNTDPTNVVTVVSATDNIFPYCFPAPQTNWIRGPVHPSNAVSAYGRPLLEKKGTLVQCGQQGMANLPNDGHLRIGRKSSFTPADRRNYRQPRANRTYGAGLVSCQQQANKESSVSIPTDSSRSSAESNPGQAPDNTRVDSEDSEHSATVSNSSSTWPVPPSSLMSPDSAFSDVSASTSQYCHPPSIATLATSNQSL